MKFRHRQLSRWFFLAALWLTLLAPMTRSQSAQPQPPKEREVLLTVSVTNDRGIPIKPQLTTNGTQSRSRSSSPRVPPAS